MISPLLLSMGIELLKTKSSNSEDFDTEKVKNVFALVDEARPFWARKTFWATVVGMAIPILNRVAGLDMEIEEVSAAVLPLVAFIGGESWRKKG